MHRVSRLLCVSQIVLLSSVACSGDELGIPSLETGDTGESGDGSGAAAEEQGGQEEQEGSGGQSGSGGQEGNDGGSQSGGSDDGNEAGSSNPESNGPDGDDGSQEDGEDASSGDDSPEDSGDSDGEDEGGIPWEDGCQDSGDGKPMSASGPCCIASPIPIDGTGEHIGCDEGSYCLSFADAPADPTAKCEPIPEGLSLGGFEGTDVLINGTVWSLDAYIEGRHEALAGVTLDAIGAQAALGGFLSAEALGSGTTDEQGHYQFQADNLTNFNATLGLLSRIQHEGYYYSGSGFMEAAGFDGYVSNFVAGHDQYVISEDLLGEWQSSLADEIAPLELGLDGGAVFFLRDPAIGPVEGAKFVHEGGPENYEVYYLQADGSFDQEATGPSGIAVVMGAETNQAFYAEKGGDAISTPNKAGSVEGALFFVSFLRTL